MKNLMIEPMACPQSAILTVAYEELKEVCDQAWEKNCQQLAKKFEVKFQNPTGPEARKSLEKTVGISKLYGQALVDYVIGKIQETSKQKVLFIHSVPRVSDYEEGKDANLYFVFYFTPEIEYPYSFKDTKLSYTPSDQFEPLLEKQLESVKKAPYSGNLNGKCRFTLELEAKATNKKDKTEYQNLSEIDMEEFRTILMTHKINDTFDYTLEEGKEVNVVIKDVYYRDDEALDDEFIKCFGHESMEVFTAFLKKNYDDRHLNSKKNMAVDHIINTLVTKGKVDPIPTEFIHYHIKRIQEEHYNKDGKKTTWDNYGVTNEAELEERLDNSVVQEFLQSMAFRCYARFNDLPFEDINAIVEHMYSQIIWD